MSTGAWRRGFAAPYALLAGFGALFATGTAAAALHGALAAGTVLIIVAVVVAAVSFAAEPLAAPMMAVIGWLTAVGFSRPPYSELRPAGPAAAHAAVVIAGAALAAVTAGQVHRWSLRRHILESVRVPTGGDARPGPAGPGADGPAVTGTPPPRPVAKAGDPIHARRRLTGIALALVLLPLLTVTLVAASPSLTLTDDLLFYLVVVVTLAAVGGFWPAVLAAVAASLLLNWYFTPPLHTFTIDKPQNLLALVLFVTVAVAVSNIVHLAASRAVLAARSRDEATSLLALARTVLGGADTPAAILGHLTQTLGGRAELAEVVAGTWVQVAVSGQADPGLPTTRIAIRDGLALVLAGQSRQATPGLLSGFAAQAAAGLDRERLRIQAAQAEALAEGNRMRTALLAAVSHDLRTPLASIKASVSSLRQPDLRLAADDERALLAAIEENADRLNGLIGNLLDMSRLHTGSLQPFLRPATVEEVAPVALHGLDGQGGLELAVPDELPLLLADPGLLERVLANLFSNALRHSPPGRPPVMRARLAGQTVVLEVADHGKGVPDELKSQIFEPFQRFDDRRAGVGLGLAVAKGFTEAMGGTIIAADTPGGGLTVMVSLPVASREQVPALGDS